jgi:hypothetical protein
MCHKSTHHSLNRLGCVPFMFLSSPVIIMGILKYNLDIDVLYPDYLYYYVNDNFLLMLNFKTNLSNFNSSYQMQKERRQKSSRKCPRG